MYRKHFFHQMTTPMPTSKLRFTTFQSILPTYVSEEEKQLAVLKQMEDTEKRQIELENSRKQWDDSMNYILMILSVTLFINILLFLLYFLLFQKVISFYVIVLLSILVLAVGIIFSLRRYYDSIIRWNMDFSVYDYPPPILETTTNDTTDGTTPITGKGNTNSAFICFNSECCAEGTRWNPNINQCILQDK
jgi:hypothetical protein